MFFVSDFLGYTATAGATTLNKLSTLNPREPERNINGTITVDFDSTPSGTVYGFVDALKNYDSGTDP